jgi:hypothetical protein
VGLDALFGRVVFDVLKDCGVVILKEEMKILKSFKTSGTTRTVTQ